jgi:hypothetical protein
MSGITTVRVGFKTQAAAEAFANRLAHPEQFEIHQIVDAEEDDFGFGGANTIGFIVMPKLERQL